MATNPNPTKLDFEQVIQRAFDNSAERLRVDSVASVESGSMEVVISDTDDSIKIGNGNNGPYLEVNADGSININVNEAANENEVIKYSEIASIAAAVETQIILYTVPLSTIFNLTRVLVSGDNKADYRVKINGVTKARERTWWTDFNATFEFSSSPKKGVKLVSGDTIQVTVIHSSDSIGAFNASIQGLEVV
jgi:hypothetical protein